MNPTHYIGIDPGVKTGFAVWNAAEKRLTQVATYSITRAMDVVREIATTRRVHLYIEDARKRTWFGNAGREQLMGAGSIKRDCSVWETFCKENGYTYTLVSPKNNLTKMSSESFRKLTGWTERCSSHARDAVWLVFGQY